MGKWLYKRIFCLPLSGLTTLRFKYTDIQLSQGRAIAEAIRSRFSTSEARVRAQIRSCGICDGLSGIGAGFLRAFRFLLTILIPPTAPHSSSIMRGWYNRPISGRRTKWTQSQPTQRI
jgi:hypothetical protein